MAVNERLTARLRDAFAGQSDVEEKKMFRGVTFMVNGKMTASAGDDELMFRIDPALHEGAIQRKGVRAVVMGGRDYTGYVRVHESVVLLKADLLYWVGLALEYNPRAKASRTAGAKTASKTAQRPSAKTTGNTAKGSKKKDVRKSTKR